MLGMNQREGRIFRMALLGHVFLVFCLFISSFIPSCEEEPEVVHVFELASSPPPPCTAGSSHSAQANPKTGRAKTCPKTNTA